MGSEGFSMYAEINPDSLMKALNPVTKLVDEAKLHISEDGLQTKAVDAANVGMVELTLDSDEFDRLESDDVTLGVNLNAFTRQLQDIADEPVGDEEQTLHIKLDDDTHRVSMWASPGSMEFTMALLDAESIREEPDIPDMDLPGRVQLMSSYFSHAVKTADNSSDHISVGMDADDNTFQLAASGDTDDWVANVPDDHHAISNLEAASVTSMFSLDYFDDMRKGIPKNVPLTMEIGNEFPVRMMFEFLDGNADVTYMVAPRIESED